jgi:dTDP-4-dehydrorhamnose reductase
MLRLAADRDEVAVVDDQRGCPTSALDLADALLTVAQSFGGASRDVIGRTFHVAGPNACSWADFAEEIFAASGGLGGPTANVRRIPTSDFPTKAVRPANSALDSGAFERAFGFALPQVRSSLDATVRRLLQPGARP